MASYYTRVDGTLKTGQTARSSDIHLIQSEIQDALQKALLDIHGTGVILGEEKNALKLEPTTNHVDQSNLNFDEENPGLSCYEIYLRQPIDIEKSSIDTIRLEMLNNSNIQVTVYAEIRDGDFDLIAETNTLLKPTDPNTYEPIDFVFKKDHLPVGRYYFVLRPIDISAIDLTLSGDESLYDTISADMFKVKYDSEGMYSNSNTTASSKDNLGLYASYDGNEYLEARYLEEALINISGNTTIAEKNFDLFFEDIFSSGNTYLITKGAAIILGEKVYPSDTHVTIDGPSTNGDRTDLVVLTTDGYLNVIKGTTYNGEKIYPEDRTGLKIAYITTYKYGISEDEKERILSGQTTLSDIQAHTYNQKVPSIEQDDENDMTRKRDILERLRRLEKKVKYQETNNSPTRIKYNCIVDPVLSNNGVDDNSTVRGEGSYGLSQGENSSGDIVLTTGQTKTLAWSIIENNYSYNYTTKPSTVTGQLTITDVHMPKTKPQNVQSFMKCQIKLTAPGFDDSSLTNNEKVPYAKMEVKIKKNSNVVATYNIKTNNDGVYALSLWNIKKLQEGSYKIYVTYNGKTVKSNMKVYADNNSFSNIQAKSHSINVTVSTVTAAQTTQQLPSTVIAGDDSFEKSHVTVDTDVGEVTIQHIGDTGEYEKNKLLKDVKVFSSSDRIYKLKSDKVALTSEYPVLNFTLESDTYVKKITPYIAGFKNIDKFGVLIFKNDFIFSKEANARKIIQKKVNKDDPIFPTIYQSEWQSLKNLSKPTDGYKQPKQPVSFTIGKDFSAGTYSLVIFGHIQSGNTEGAIKIKEYITGAYKKEYGIATKCIGSSKLSIINMDTTNLTNKSWDVLIEQKPYKYYDSGILISKTIDTSNNIKGCQVNKKHRSFEIPDGCNINLYVSNNGGTSWVNANSGNITFNGNGHLFRWKLEMTSNSTHTPKLYYNNTRKYAISFTLVESNQNIEYEDYQRCYETPILNANSITRTYVGNNLIKNRFSEWEFARLFIEDEELQSKIDILISYADDDYDTNVGSTKSNWGNNIFFSQIFADLTLDDFSRESVDYDNYQGNVEYDEYNYPFKLQNDDLISNTGGYALASPDVYAADNISCPYQYGDISATDSNGLPINDIYNIFQYEYIESTYEYKDNDGDSTKKYAGMHVVNSPMWQAKLVNSDFEYTPEDVILGVSFRDVLDVDDNLTYVKLGLKPIVSTERSDENHHEIITNADGTDTNVEQYFFPPGTFDVVVAINQHGEVDDTDATSGKAYTINKKLIANEYNEVTIDFIDDLKGFSASGIGSIGIRVKNADLLEGEGIQLGRITTGSYSIRPYVPYMYTGKWDRLAWQTDNNDCQAYAMYRLGVDQNNTNNASTYKVFYPITNQDKDAESAKITFNGTTTQAKYTIDSNTTTDTIKGNNLINTGNNLKIWNSRGTSRKPNDTQDSSVIRRIGHELKTTITKNNKTNTYLTNNTGNQTLFYLPPDKEGILFKINTNIPYTIYDLIDIEYYMFTTYTDNENNNANVNSNVQYYADDSGTNHTYTTHGHFSKGDICINLYDTRNNIESATPVESFALPAWGLGQTKSHVSNKVVHSWFKKRSDAVTIKAITIERKNPRKNEKGDNSIPTDEMFLLLNDILFVNAETEAALGPQLQMRIYPNTPITNNTKIRKFGGIYRI